MEPSLKKNQGQKLFHGICFDHIFLPESQSKNLSSEKRERVTLLKYFPKHIAKLHFKFSDGPQNTRIKHLKLVQELSCEAPRDNFWRLVAANKRKTVQSFRQDKDQPYSKLNVQCLKMFPNTKMIKLCLEDREEFEDEEEWDQQLYWVNRISGHLNHLNNLKYLKLSLLSQDLFGPLSKLKKSQRVLSHLQFFEIHLTWSSNHEYEILQRFSTCKEILRNLTDLSLGMLAGKDFFEAFQVLSESCPRLSSLDFGTSQKDFHLSYQYEFEDDIVLEHSTYLKCLQNFSNLRTLNIRTCHGFDFLQYCQFPTSLRKLDLSFWKIDWKNLREGSSKGLLEFNSKPENLLNLEELEVGFSEFCDDSPRKKALHDREIAINTFLQAFFKRIQTCKELYLTLSSPHVYPNEFKESPFLFDVPEFLKEIEHFGQSLMTLKISDKCREYYFNNFNAKSDVFPMLSYFSLASEISPSIAFENIFNFAQNKGENNEIILDGIKVKSSEEFLNLLKSLGKIKNIIAEKERVELVVYCQDFEADGEYFEKNYEDVAKDIGRLKNVFLTLRIKKSDAKFSQKLKSFKPLLGDLQIRGKSDWEKY